MSYPYPRLAARHSHRSRRQIENRGRPNPHDGEAATHVITLRRSSVVRVGIGFAVLAALGAGFAIGLAASSPSPATARVVVDAATTSGSLSATAAPKGTAATSEPTVVSCRPGSKSRVRPTTIDIDCTGGATSISSVTWSFWGSDHGSGSGMLTVKDCHPNCATGSARSSPAFVVVSRPQGGVFQDVQITPPGGALTPLASSDPGSGWGSG